MAWGCFLSTVWYVAFASTIAYIHPLFCFATIIYAFIEGNILLAVINFTWHAFIDPEDPSNDYVNSTTVIEGLNFTLGEEYHVVHHQYAGVHWTRHEELYLKHAEGYKQCIPTSLYKQNAFEIFGAMVSKNYLQLAKWWYPEHRQGLTDAALAEVIKRRLQAHGPDLAVSVGRTHKAKELETILKPKTGDAFAGEDFVAGKDE